ncbi:MAG: lamin tail domain-containing protein [Verrucomicrobiales bacterium]
MRKLLLSFVWAVLLPATAGFSAPVITEILADNNSSITDEDGAHSDWIEIFNPDNTPVNLAGWHLTDDADDLVGWTFPAVTLQPGQFLIVWASGKNRTAVPGQLHTNFHLDESGEYLALVAPDGVTKSSEFANFPALESDQSYGVTFGQQTLVTQGTAANILVPGDDSLGSSWTGATFTPGAGWLTAPINVGFGMLVPGFTVQERKSSTPLNNLANTEACLAGTNATDNNIQTRPVVNFAGSGGGVGHFLNDGLFFHNGMEDFAVRATGLITIPTTGPWSFLLNSDDGGRVRIDRNNDGDFTDAGETVISVDVNRGATDSFGTVASLAAGSYPFEVIYWERGGGEALEVAAAPGSLSAFSNAFDLIGDVANGGLSILTTPGGGGGTALVNTDIGPQMLNVNSSVYVRVPFTLADATAVDSLSFSMGYNDGFVAYLNGTEIARRNAPAGQTYNSTASAARGPGESVIPEIFNASPFKGNLLTGTNVLAIHGLNVTAADTNFFAAPALSAGDLQPGGPFYFRQVTPGASNTAPGFLGKVGDTNFSVKRGHYSAPIDVAITTATPGATIRYTTNGSTPTQTNGTDYTAPIHITSTTVLRAAAFLTGYEPTNTDTNTYVFLDDVITQSANGARPGPDWPNPGTINGQIIDYGMDPDIVNNPNPAIGGAVQVKAALMALPTVVLTTDLPNLYNPSTGIYVNPGGHGSQWERPASIEMFNDIYSSSPLPPNEKGFQANCGLRIRGGFSRDPANPKHAWRLFFRSEYGDGKLNYPVFQNEGVDEFDSFDIQTSQNYSWAYQNNPQNTFLREIWSRDLQRDMGHHYTRGRFVHLYINAQYWGLFQIEERPENSFGASYLGGDPDNMDVIKATGNSAGYTVEATDGDFLTHEDPVTHQITDSPWKMLWDRSRASYFINTNRQVTAPYGPQTYTTEQKNAAYFRVMGLAADGKTPIADPVLIDIVDMIDMMLVIFFAGNTDAPLSNFLGNNNPNNFFAIRDRTENFGFISPLHDAEHTLDAGAASPDRIGSLHDAANKHWYYNNPTGGNWNNINFSNQQFFHQDYMPNAEYRMLFADRIYKHMFNNGAMTTANNIARMQARVPFVEGGIIGESARWGDAKRAVPFNKNDWTNAKNSTLTWFNNRNAAFLNLAKQKYLYPSTEAPIFNQHGGNVPTGFQVTLSHPPGSSGTIYYTTDGSDPRPVGNQTTTTTTVLAPEFSNASYLVPSEGNGGSVLTIPQWTAVADPPNAANWTTSQLGYGFKSPAPSTFDPFIMTNLQSQMQSINATCYIRLSVPVTQQDKDSIGRLRLRMRYDDAYIAYLNGTEIARKTVNAAFVPSWNSLANNSHSDSAAIVFENVDISGFVNLLQVGNNVLAIHGMNSIPSNPDFLISPQIEYDTFSSSGVTALVYTGPITLSDPTTIKTRSAGSDWSALNEASFIVNAVPASAANLVVSEFHYNPLSSQNPTESGYSANDFEFIELLNISASAVDLSGVKFSVGVLFDFEGTPLQLTLPPGGRILAVGHSQGFQARYGAGPGPIAGQFTGSLDNGGELLTLVAANGSVIKEFTYDDVAPWPGSADGEGYSLVLIHPTANPDHTNPTNWRMSTAINGNPGAVKGSLAYSAWKTANGVVNELIDGDFDGVSNLLEYAFGTSPAASSVGSLPRVRVMPITVNNVEANYLVLEITRSLANDDVLFKVQSSSNLAVWSGGGAVLVDEIHSGNGTSTITYRSLNPFPADGRLFLRAVAELLP